MTEQVTQKAEDLDPQTTKKLLGSVRAALYKQPAKNAAFREWVLRSYPNDRLPRGHYFKGRPSPKPFIIDEAWHLKTK